MEIRRTRMMVFWLIYLDGRLYIARLELNIVEIKYTKCSVEKSPWFFCHL